MAKRLEKEKAIQLRLRGWSYSQIKREIGVAKASLSLWLQDYPLSEERMKLLRSPTDERIEKCRNTKALKHQKRLKSVYQIVAKDIGSLTRRELFLAGLFLYWGEGAKNSSATIALSNTDPKMISFYLRWLECLGVSKDKLKIKLHLYSDMNKGFEKAYWSKVTGLPLDSFRKTYLKESKLANLSYKNGFGHGTCMIIFQQVKLHEYVLMSLDYIKAAFC